MERVEFQCSQYSFMKFYWFLKSNFGLEEFELNEYVGDLYVGIYESEIMI